MGADHGSSVTAKSSLATLSPKENATTSENSKKPAPSRSPASARRARWCISTTMTTAAIRLGLPIRKSVILWTVMSSLIS